MCKSRPSTILYSEDPGSLASEIFQGLDDRTILLFVIAGAVVIVVVLIVVLVVVVKRSKLGKVLYW